MKNQETQASHQVWYMFFPFRNSPGRPGEPDLHDQNPYGKPDSSAPPETHQTGIRFDRCIDTDMCFFIMAERSNQKERRVLVELFGTDVPHLRASCEHERILATDAMEFFRQTLSNAAQIDVYDHYRVGSKHMARVVVDGQDLSQLLISQGFAAAKGQGRIDWCIG